MSNGTGKSFGVKENERIRAAARELLAEHGGNQRELAKALKVAQPTVSNLLSGRSGAGVQLAGAIAQARGVTLDELATGKRKVGAAALAAVPGFTDSMKKFRALQSRAVRPVPDDVLDEIPGVEFSRPPKVVTVEFIRRLCDTIIQGREDDWQGTQTGPEDPEDALPRGA